MSDEDILDRVMCSGAIKDEIMFRLGQPQVLRPFTAEDFAAIANELALPAGVIDPEQAAASGRNFRYVELRLAELAVERQLAWEERLSTRCDMLSGP